MKCEKCNREMMLVHDMDHFHCPDCHTYHFPDSSAACSDSIVPSGKTSDLKCPHCPGQHLAFGEMLGQRVCFCLHCKGYLIGRRSLASLVCTLRSAYDGPEDTPVMICQNEMQVRSVCPSCRRNMDTHPYYGPGNIVIDSCANCEITWLNYGELVKIVRAPGERDSGGVIPGHRDNLLDTLFEAPRVTNRG